MGQHKTHTMHENSMKSWRQLNHKSYKWMICDAFNKFGALTDREVMERAGIIDKNDASPVITRLIKDCVLVDCGKVKCETTGRTVRVCMMDYKGESK